jgi:hypothetical protein
MLHKVGRFSFKGGRHYIADQLFPATLEEPEERTGLSFRGRVELGLAHVIHDLADPGASG